MRSLTAGARESLLAMLKARFEKNDDRHQGVAWSTVAARLTRAPAKLWTLSEMERTGGEPDVIGMDDATDALVFVDCSTESPAGRRSLCFDIAALRARKEAKPVGAAVDLAGAMGADLLDEALYRRLQTLGAFDTKTSSWLATPPAIRRLGGALFGDRRYGAVFIYHNGAQSYYAARGFRAALRV